MSDLKDLKENISETIDLGSKIARKASPKPWSRVLLAAFLGIVVMLAGTICLTIQISEYAKKSDAYWTESDFAQKESRDQQALDYLQLCIDAQRNNDVNKDYYCADAVEFYKSAFVQLPDNKVKENIDRSAYGAMRVDMAVRLRASALERMMQKAPQQSDTLKFMLSPLGQTLLCLIIAVVMLTSTWVTYCMARAPHAEQ